MRPLSVITILVLLFSLQTQAQPKVLKKIKKELNATVNSKEFSTANIGFCLMDAQTGKVLVEYNSQKAFTTASAMKVVTTGAALALLGDTFKFKTELIYTGSITNGVLNGNIYICGNNDPTTGSDRWPGTHIDSITHYFTNAIIKLGITKITGAIVGYDNTNGDNILPDFTVGDLDTRYGVPPFGLNYKENFTEITDTTVIIDTLDPNIIRTLVSVERYSPYNESGEPNPQSPPYLFAYALTQKLQDNGITVSGNAREGYGMETNGDTITVWHSKPLLEIATETNQQSVNLFAESILRVIRSTPPAYLEYCIDDVTNFWKNEVGDLKGLRMTDGSGLSRSNLCTPLLFCKMLSAYTKRTNFDSFYSTFPVAGQSGTVKKFATGTKAEGNAHIKTGTMSRVKSYVGYVTGNDGKLYSFALMYNNFEADVKPAISAAKIIALLPQLKTGKFFKVN